MHKRIVIIITTEEAVHKLEGEWQYIAKGYEEDFSKYTDAIEEVQDKNL